MKEMYRKFKNHIRRKGTFYKLMFSYIFIIICMLTISMLVLYQGYKDQTIEQSKIISKKAINQGEYYYGYTLSSAKSYIYQLYLDNYIYNLMFYSNSNPSIISSGLMRIKQAVSMLQSVQSIYVYNYNTKMIYSSSGTASYYSLFRDNEIIQILNKENEPLSINAIPRQIVVSLNGETYKKNVLTVLLINIKDDSNGMPYGAIVLNMDANAVQKYFDNLSQNNYNLMAVNKVGKIVLNSDKSKFLQDISHLDYINKIIKSDKKDGEFLSDINGKPAVITYQYDEKLNLFFISIVKYETMFGSIRNVFNLIIITCMILFSLGLIFSIFSSKNIYLPIAKAVDKVKKYSDIEDSIKADEIEKNAENEIEYIIKVMDRLMNKPISLDKLSKNDLSFLKTMLLKGIILNLDTQFENFIDKLSQVGFDITDCNMVIVLYKFDSYRNIANKKDDDELNNLKNKVCKEILLMTQGFFQCEAISIEKDDMCLIIKFKETEKDGMIENLVDLIEKIQEDIIFKFNVSLSAAMGKFVYKIEDLSVAYKTALDCSKYRFKYGLKSILYNELITKDISDESKYDRNIEDTLSKLVKSGNIDNLEAELDRIFNIIKKMSYSDMMMSITELSISSQKIINYIYEISNEDAYIDIKGITDSIFKFETLDEVKEYYLNLFKNVIIQLNDKRSNRKNIVIKNVKKYINENYQDQLLSLDIIASKMRFSSNYLTALFKDIEGMTISSYIKEVRFNKAIELLRTTELTETEISLKVGFANVNYFYTSFRKRYGLSPKQYRNSKYNV